MEPPLKDAGRYRAIILNHFYHLITIGIVISTRVHNNWIITLFAKLVGAPTNHTAIAGRIAYDRSAGPRPIAVLQVPQLGQQNFERRAGILRVVLEHRPLK